MVQSICGTTLGMVALGLLLDYIYLILSLVHSKTRILMLCIIRLWVIQHSLITTHVSLLINLNTNSPSGPSWKANARFFQEAKDPIMPCGKCLLPKCISSLNLGEQ